MLSKNQIKRIRSLHQKKFRNELGLFIAEGPKLTEELLQSNINVKEVYALAEALPKFHKNYPSNNPEFFEISGKDLERIGALKTPNEVLAVVEIPDNKPDYETIFNQPVLVLDNIQDPGNLGTIIRSADWFGFKNIVCSKDTVEVYNPKVVQATMGSISRVNVFYFDLEEFFEKAPASYPVYGTLLEGKNIYTSEFNKSGVIIIGNESKGIGRNIQEFVTEKITILPHKGERKENAESLNASVAASLVMAEFRRQNP